MNLLNEEKTDSSTQTFEYNGNSIIKKGESVNFDTIVIYNKSRIIKKTNSTTIPETGNTASTSYEYDTEGNLIKEISDYETITYTYDKSKKGAFRTVESPQWLMVLLTDMTTDYANAVTDRLYSSTYNPNVNSIFTNSFNADGYPTQQILTTPNTIGAGKETITISYVKPK